MAKIYTLVSGFLLLFLTSCNVTVCSGDCNPDPGPDPEFITAMASNQAIPTEMLNALTQTGAAPALRRAERLSDRQVSNLTKKSVDKNPWEIWFEASFADIEDDRYGADISSDVVDFTGGISYRVNNDLSIGIASGYEELEAIGYNKKAYIEQDGLIIGPYAAYRILDQVIGDVWIGYRNFDGDSKITSSRGDYDGDGYFLATSLTGLFDYGPLQLRPKATLFYSDSEADDYDLRGAGTSTRVTEHDQTFGITEFSTAISRTFDQGDDLMLTPYVRAGVTYEFERAIDDRFLSSEYEEKDPSRWRGNANLGIEASFAEQAIIELEGGYDGVGESDYDIWSIRGAIKIPLN